MSTPEISIIMLTYNREHLIKRAINSILAQTFDNYEFLIVDNGSTDNSGKIADEYAQNNACIRVIHRVRGNIGSGRNAGLEAASGKYVAFIDDDDWAEPDFLEFLYQLITENSADVAICGAADKIYDEKLVFTSEQALIELMRRKKYNMAFPTKMFTRELSQKIRFPANDKYDDISQMHKLLAYADKIVYHGLPKYTFYRHENNHSAWTTHHELLTADILKEYLHTYRQRTQWLSEKFPNSTDLWNYFEWSFMISMVEKINRLGIPNCDAQLMYMKEELSKHQETFMNSKQTADFEKAWMKQYILS